MQTYDDPKWDQWGPSSATATATSDFCLVLLSLHRDVHKAMRRFSFQQAAVNTLCLLTRKENIHYFIGQPVEDKPVRSLIPGSCWQIGIMAVATIRHEPRGGVRAAWGMRLPRQATQGRREEEEEERKERRVGVSHGQKLLRDKQRKSGHRKS